ncbi:hypothetical protein LINGRAPRIM_LOCUS1439 [Linum grandiflorum]
MELFRSTTSSSSDSPPDSPTLASMYLQIQNQKQQQPPPPLIRSISDDVYSKPTFPAFNPSPASILTPHLTTILSGKEFSTEKLEESNDSTPTPLPPQRQQRKVERRIRGSKSLTDLECEELKGFMDLGFVFSEKDKDSRLVSILPGLQKLGKTEEEEEKGRKKIVKKKPLMNLRVSIGSDVELKDSLRMWAHSVASTVR